MPPTSHRPPPSPAAAHQGAGTTPADDASSSSSSVIEPFEETTNASLPRHYHPPGDESVPNHYHPHKPDTHHEMAKPSAKDPHRVDKNTHKYNALNAMEYPALFGVQQTTIPKTSLFLDRLIDNVSNYALAYPLAGTSVVPRKYGVQVQTDKGMFYAGKDQALGSNYFVPLGTCGEDSVPGCKGQPKMVYIRNIPTGQIPLLNNVSMHSVTGCNIEGVSNGQGLVPGMLEDLSEVLDIGGANSVGDKCRRIRLPVGTHIYDPNMKCELDYTRIDSKPTMEAKHQETLRQIHDNCGNDGYKNKTWWYEERCTPSYNNCSTANGLGGDDSKHEANK